MLVDEAQPQGDWLSMAEAMAAIREVGKLPEEAATLLYRHLSADTLLAKANTIQMEYSDGEVTCHSDSEVPVDLWICCPLPPLGHRFWMVGDVRFRPPYDADDLSLDPVPPIVTILGAKVFQHGLLAIVRAIEGAEGRGRRKGTGGYIEADEPLVLEMHALVASKSVSSVNQAAMKLAQRAKGGGTEESKAKRLLGRYMERFPQP